MYIELTAMKFTNTGTLTQTNILRLFIWWKQISIVLLINMPQKLSDKDIFDVDTMNKVISRKWTIGGSNSFDFTMFKIWKWVIHSRML
jgi:hypothetical protein